MTRVTSANREKWQSTAGGSGARCAKTADGSQSGAGDEAVKGAATLF
jgi:hypothetical protein